MEGWKVYPFAVTPKCEIMMPLAECDLESLLEYNEISVWERIDMALQIAMGIEQLHRIKIVFRDLKHKNILVFNQDGNWKQEDGRRRFRLCLTDFGISRAADEGKTMNLGTFNWSSPEASKGLEAMKMDVFSFGYLMWYHWSRKEPHQGMDQISIADAKRSGKPENPPRMKSKGGDCPDEYVDLMLQCWRVNPKERPEMREIVNKLQQIRSSLPLILKRCVM